jgi:hypothetical protein
MFSEKILTLICACTCACTALMTPHATAAAVADVATATTTIIAAADDDNVLRPPAVPLVANDPYFSIWSPADTLTGADTRFWSGKTQRISSQVTIDGQAFRVIGLLPSAFSSALVQKSLTVLPTRTIYVFEDAAQNARVRLTLTFMTPALPDDLDVLARPVTYVTYAFESLDAKPHEIAIQFSAAGDITANEPDETVVTGSMPKVQGLATVRLGAKNQRMLWRTGDGIAIDWGYLYVAADTAHATGALATGTAYENAFATPATATTTAAAKTGIASDITANLAYANLRFTPFKTTRAGAVSRTVILAYDDLFSVQYFGQNLRPYWRRNGWEAADLLTHAAKDHETLRKRCEALDAELMSDLTRAGGVKYAKIAALAYRQCFAAGKFTADANGQPLQFCKENHSGGFIGTSDVFYPMSPLFLLNGPTLTKSFIVPFMNYAASPRWPFNFAPHDLGSYPIANGQLYGAREKGLAGQMPVEESGNLLILFAAVAHMEGNASFAALYWPVLEKWAAYLKEKGFDPENQLTTDDFAGPCPHHTNLSIKAIMGLASFAKLCDMRGDTAKAREYRDTARDFAQKWAREADDGDHYRLAFDQPGTWNMKYNLVWDRILGLDIFPAEIARKEMDFYLKTQNEYGLPLDSRRLSTKLDWIVWTATLTQNRSDFEALTTPIFKFLNKTGQRAPMTDFYRTHDATKVNFTARPVVGGVFIPLLYDKTLWKKYASREKTKAANWAPLPKNFMNAKPVTPPKKQQPKQQQPKQQPPPKKK